ncbi:uncharacterized protein LOC122502308 isoform X2 [Leptopilina heterotoma]|uniref:uncharacterized protein LOC122502308 isoform X2 n=1 Tax=Leptopilina heterotoma TaxID=63436 RepID=UPI001CA84C72|nr:uncharacterized protein LOC122502308 isoform X2 [Leptopilina heterotoma]
MNRILSIAFYILVRIASIKSNSLIHDEYVNLISEIYDWSKSTTVTLLHFNSNDELFKKNSIFQMQFLLIKKNIRASDINLEKVASLEDERIYNFKGLRKDDKAMSIFLLTSMHELNVMKNFTCLLTRTKIIYFALFMESGDSVLREICLKPIGNPFGLNKGVSFLVKCHDDNMIREWHSINGNETEIHERGIWSKESGFNETSNETIVNDYDILSGKTLYSIMSVEDNVQEKYFNKLIRYLENGGNCTIKKFESMTYYKIYNQSSTTWNNMKQLFFNGSLDLGMGFFSYVPTNLKDFDFSEPLAKIQFVLIIKAPTIKVNISFNAYIKPFTLRSWIAFTFIVIISLTIQVLIFFKLKTSFCRKISIRDEILHILGIFLHQSIPEFKKPTASKVLQTSISMFILIIISLYTGSFVSKLTYSGVQLPFNSVEEYAKAKSHKLIVFKHTANYYKLKICNDNVALFTDELFFQMIRDDSIKFKCRCIAIATGEYHPVTFILKKSSPYTETMRKIIQKLENFGILTRLKNKVIRNKNYNNFTSIPFYESITFIETITLLVIVIGGVAISALILFIENIYSYCRKKLLNMKQIQATFLFKQTTRLIRHKKP